MEAGARTVVAKTISHFTIFGKSVCMQNTKHRRGATSYSAISEQLKTQWDFVVRSSNEAHAAAVARGKGDSITVIPSMSANMLEAHFMEHIDDPEIQNARNRFFMADAIRRKRAHVSRLWDADPENEAEENADAEKDAMADFIKYQKTYATMTAREGTPKRQTDEH